MTSEEARVRGEPTPGLYPISAGTAELLRDADRENGWVLTVGGVLQSYVDLSEPTYLDFEYLRLMGAVIDGRTPRSAAVDAVHVGGAACALPRYVAATRPGSRQIVFELDAGLVRLAREQLALDTVPGLDVRISDGRAGVTDLPDDSADLMVVDAFSAATISVELATREFADEAARVLRPNGVYLVNVSDGAPLAFSRRVAAGLAEVFAYTTMLVQSEVLYGRRFGNLVLAGAAEPLDMPRPSAASGGDPVRAQWLHGHDLARFYAGAAPLRDGDGTSAPKAPPEVYGADPGA